MVVDCGVDMVSIMDMDMAMVLGILDILPYPGVSVFQMSFLEGR